MSVEFEPVYESADGQPVRLEAAALTTADGTDYLHHRLIVADGRTGAVVIGVSERRMLLVLSARTALGADLWELPRGSGETGESELETATRELREETGMLGREPQLLGRYVIDSSIFPQTVAVVSCQVDAAAPRDARDGEIRDERWVDAADVPGLVDDGTIRDAHSLAALAVYWSGKDDR